MTRRFEHDPLGRAKCPGCGQDVFCAWDDEMTSIALDRDDSGDLAVSLDGNRIPWCRNVAAHDQLALDEHLYRRHEPQCPAPVATVTPIGSAPSLRRPCPVPEERTANAR